MLRSMINWMNSNLSKRLSSDMASSFGLSKTEYQPVSSEDLVPLYTTYTHNDQQIPNQSINECNDGATSPANGESKKKRKRKRKPRLKKVALIDSDTQKQETKCSTSTTSNGLQVMEANAFINLGCGLNDRDLNSRWAQLKFEDITITFNRRVRLPSDLIEPIEPDFNDYFETTKESYARVVSSNNSQMRWKKELDWQTGLLLSQLDKWKEQFKLFSVSVDLSQPEQAGDCGTKPDKMKAQILVNRLKKCLNECFRGVVQIEEVVVRLDGSKHQSIYFGPTRQTVEKELVSNVVESKTEKPQVTRQPRRKTINENRLWCSPKINFGIEHERLADGSPTGELPNDWNMDEPRTAGTTNDAFIDLEDEIWRKRAYSSKRKKGKANKKRGRLLAVSPEINKNEKALMESEPVPSTAKNLREELQIKRHIELQERKPQRKENRCQRMRITNFVEN